MFHGDEYQTKAPVRPGHVGLNAAAEHCPVPALVVTYLEPGFRDAAFSPQLLAKFPERDLGACGKPLKIVGEGIFIEADRKDRVRPPFDHGLALVVCRQRAEVLVELLGTKTLLTVPSKDCLDRGISALHGLKSCQGGIHPVLG